jgi:hypothetical protein
MFPPQKVKVGHALRVTFAAVVDAAGSATGPESPEEPLVPLAPLVPLVPLAPELAPEDPELPDEPEPVELDEHARTTAAAPTVNEANITIRMEDLPDACASPRSYAISARAWTRELRSRPAPRS